jgi:hypothetical protein
MAGHSPRSVEVAGKFAWVPTKIPGYLSLLKSPSGQEIGLPMKAMADDFQLFE